MSDLRDDPYKIASEKGLEVIPDRDDLLMLDLDEPASDTPVLERAVRLVEACDEFPAIVRGPVTTSPGGKGQHAYFALRGYPTLTTPERLCLQASMGSDRAREALGLARALGKVQTQVLFETPAEAARVRAWLATLPPAPQAAYDDGHPDL